MAVSYPKKYLQLLGRLSKEQRSDVFESVRELAQQAEMRPRRRDRAALLRRTSGALRDTRGSSEDFIRAKSEEIAREERRGIR